MQAIDRQPQGAPHGAQVYYERHRPEQTTLTWLVQQQASSLIAQIEAGRGSALPRFIKDGFDAFRERGILAYGSLRLRCGEGGHDKLLAFRCKHRGRTEFQRAFVEQAADCGSGFTVRRIGSQGAGVLSVLDHEQGRSQPANP